MELSDFEKTDKLLSKMENAYNPVLRCQTIHSAAQIVEIQECLVTLILSRPKKLHLIGANQTKRRKRDNMALNRCNFLHPPARLGAKPLPGLHGCVITDRQPRDLLYDQHCTLHRRRLGHHQPTGDSSWIGRSSPRPRRPAEGHPGGRGWRFRGRI